MILWIAMAANAAAAPRHVSAPPPPPQISRPIALPLPPTMPGDPGKGPVPAGNPGEWVTTNDYPSSALRAEQEGIVGFRVTVGPTGAVNDCVIVTSSGFPVLDDATCRLVTMRARFTPATDAKGGAVVGYYSNRVRWVIPTEMSQPVAGSEVMTLIVEKDGSQSNCQIIRSDPGLEGAPPVGPVPCGTRRIDPPFTNPKGEPIRKRIISTMSTALEDVKE